MESGGFCQDVLVRNAHQRTCEVTAHFISTRGWGVDASSLKNKALENNMVKY